MNGKNLRQIKIYDAPKKALTVLALPRNENDFFFELLDDRTALVQFYADKLEDCALYLVSNQRSRLLRTGIGNPMVTDGRIGVGLLRRAQPAESIKFWMVKNGAYEEFDSGVHGSRASLYRTKEGIVMSFVRDGTQPTNGRLPTEAHLLNVQRSTFEKFEFKEPGGIRWYTPQMPGWMAAKVLRAEIGNLILEGDAKSEFPSAIIATDTREGQFSYEGNFVYYRFGEHLFVREIRPVTDEELERILEQAEMKKLLTQAKQLGTSLMIYISQNNDVFPGRNEKVTDLLMPITKNSELFTGFVYTFEGGSATAIAEPTQQVLGYIQGKYGRAVIYSDSHAKWESRKP